MTNVIYLAVVYIVVTFQQLSWDKLIFLDMKLKEGFNFSNNNNEVLDMTFHINRCKDMETVKA